MLFNIAHLVFKGVSLSHKEMRHEVYCGQCCAPAVSPEDWRLVLSYSGDDSQEKHSPLQLKPALVRHPASRRGLNGIRPVPPIPRLASPLPHKIELSVTKWKNEECEDTWVNGVGRKLAADLSELTLDGEEVDQEEVCLNVFWHTSATDRL